jgi:hypothetical protein
MFTYGATGQPICQGTGQQACRYITAASGSALLLIVLLNCLLPHQTAAPNNRWRT